MKCHDASRSAGFTQASQHGRWVVDERQQEPADRRVELFVEIDRADTPRAELDVRHALRGSSLVGDVERRPIDVDSDHRTVRPDDFAHEERHVADAAADIEYLHPGRDAGGVEHPLCHRAH